MTTQQVYTEIIARHQPIITAHNSRCTCGWRTGLQRPPFDSWGHWCDHIGYVLAGAMLSETKIAALERFADERGDAIQAALAVLPDECWVFKSTDITCMSLVGGTFANGATFTEEACCVPCRVRAALTEDSVDPA